MTNSEKPSEPEFKAAAIPVFSVIRIPYKFEDETGPISKLFVVVAHQNGHVFCLKTTSQTVRYESDKNLMAGCVYYVAHEIGCFTENTAIQPENQFAIPYSHIEEMNRRDLVEVHPQLPADFRKKLQKAIDDSVVLKDPKRSRLRKLISTNT